MARSLERGDRARVLYVIQQREPSGAEAFVADVMRADPDPLLACPAGSGVETWAARLGVPTVSLPFRSLRHSGGWLETLRSVPRGLVSARDLRRVLREHPERRIVYCSSLRPGLLATLARIGLGRRTLWVVTDWLPPGLLGRATRLAARVGCDRAAATSRAIAADFAGGSTTLSGRTTVVYPGVDPGRFASEVGRRPTSAAIVGAISPTKRTDLAIDIAARVARELPDFELDIVGRALYRDEDFALEAELQRRVAGDGDLSEHVRFRGHTDEVASRLAETRLLLHCRPDEPFGIVLTEAMAAGLPVVAPAAGGPCEIVADGVTGLLFPPDDAAGAAARVVSLLRDPEAARSMGEAGRARVRERFSVEDQVAAFDTLLAGLDE